MKKVLFRLTALMVAVCLLFSGCSLLGSHGVPFEDMVYARPSLPELSACADRCTELGRSGDDLDKLWMELIDFFALYSDFYTQYLLAYVHYCKDMTDLYWADEYNYCEERTALAEATRDRLLHELAKSPLREQLEGEDYLGSDYFDDYDGESLWTDEFQTLKEQESELLSDYYQIIQEGTDFEPGSDEYYDTVGIKLETLYIEMVALRQQLAKAAGYDSYPEYAYEQVYYRDYSVSDAIGFCQQVYEELVPLYRELAESEFWEMGIYYAGENDTYRYVRTMATNMGGRVARAFEQMSQNNLYDISRRDNKYDNSFEVYFYDYEQPYIFISPTGTEMDHLSFAHEFGHFCNDQVSYGSTVGIDTAEVFSQGMEYLSLFYAHASEELTLHKLGDGLCVYVEQGAYSCFEQQVYELSPEELSVERVRDLFLKTGAGFGLDCWELDGRRYVSIPHFFLQPLYVISYAVSNDTAFQLYQLEQQHRGDGLDIYLKTLDTEQEDFLPFLEEAGLDSPFLEGRIRTVKETLQNALL